MNKLQKEIQNLKHQFSLTQKEAQQYNKIIQHRLSKEISAVKKLNLLKGRLILECGTGQGRFTQGLVDNLLKPDQILYTIDSTPQMIKNAQTKIRRKNFYPQVADLWKIPFPDNHFDALISHYTLHGLRSKSKDFLIPFKEMLRVLKPGAPLIAMTFYYDKGENSSAYLYHRLIQLNYQDKGISFLGLKNPEIYKNFLRKAGLKKTKSKVINFDSFPFPEKLRDRIHAARLKDEKNLIKKIKSSKLRKEAEKVLRSFESKPELKNKKIGPTLLLWGKKSVGARFPRPHDVLFNSLLVSRLTKHSSKKMKLNLSKTLIYTFFSILIITSLSCFSSLQTAKTRDGFGFTTGVYRYEFLHGSDNHWEDHYFLILAPSIGRTATERRLGLEGRFKILTDAIDKDEEHALWFPVGELKIQAYKNRYIDYALAAEFWLFYPTGLSVIVSRDINEHFTLYGQYKLMSNFYVLSLRESETGLTSAFTLGTEINLTKNISTLFEVERWLASEHLSEREKTRYSLGVNFHFPLSKE